MTVNLLLLGGTTEARRLASAVAGAGLRGTVSLAGRVERPAPQGLPLRNGGFGGIEGLAAYLRQEAISHVIDATHPFAAQMSTNATAACAETGVPLMSLTRPAWEAGAEDHWIRVPDMAGAVAALDRPASRVMLAVGRMHLAEFAPNPQHDYLLRLVDPPDAPLPFPNHHVLVDRGPFRLEDDLRLLEEHRIQFVVSKNAGGAGARAKIDAARRLGLPVIMIDRPTLPPRAEVHSVEEALAWLHGATERGV